MTTKQFRVYRFNVTVGITVVVALLLALHMGLALTQGDIDPTEEISTYVSRDAVRDLSCTPGITGSCTVQYVDAVHPSAEEAIEDCGARYCLVRIELRW